MLRRFSRPGFRRRAFVKRRKFGYRGKFKRRNYKKRLVGGAARAARSSYTNTPMCRDLGSIWPSCLITKIRFHAVVPADYRTQLTDGGMTSTTGEGTSYSAFINMWPNYSATPTGVLKPATYGGTASTEYKLASYTGWSVDTTDSMGVDKLLAEGKSGSATGPYSRMCVLAANYRYTLSFLHKQSQAATTPLSFVPPSEHFLHPMCSKDQIITPITTQSHADSFWNQPDVQRRYKAGSVGVALGTTSGATQTHTIPGVSVQWRGKIWPHKLLDKTFTDYVSDDSSFGTYVAYPTNFVGHQLGGLLMNNGQASASFVPPGIGVLHINIVFTCLFKDIAGVQS